MSGAPSGILLVDKPTGPTSRQVVEEVGRLLAPAAPRRRRGESRFRVGHAGTLDPLATGLLLVLVGKGTRLQPFLQGLDKRYLATVRFGAGTDSHDTDGEVTGRAPVEADPDALAAAAARLTGTIMQVPPLISAIKRDGRSLHHRVRRGEDPAPPPARPVEVHALTVTAVRWNEQPADGDGGPLPPDGHVYEADLDIACGSGTYVRSLARDLAAAVGTLGHVTALRRTEVGPFAVADAVTPDALVADGAPLQRLLPPAAALPHLPAVTVTADQAAALRQGMQPERSWLDLPEVPALFRLVTAGGSLAAVGRRDPDDDQPRTVAVFAAAVPEDDPCA